MKIKLKRRPPTQKILGKRVNCDGRDRKMFVHETMATDTDNIKKVFQDVKVGFQIFLLLGSTC